jgi:hypothetical protein
MAGYRRPILRSRSSALSLAFFKPQAVKSVPQPRFGLRLRREIRNPSLMAIGDAFSHPEPTIARDNMVGHQRNILRGSVRTMPRYPLTQGQL